MSILYYVYAAILLIGGIVGFARAQSVPSLIASTIAAIIVAISGVILPHHPRAGLGLGILVSLALSVFFSRRYAATKKAMPAIPIIALSVLVLIASIIKLTGALPHH